jgi:hypothetical protein
VRRRHQAIAAAALLVGACVGGGAWATRGSAAARAPAALAAATPHVVVIGVAGLRWDDISPDATPALWGLVSRSALGAASVKAADPVSCPQDGWLTLGAGNRATAHLGRDCAASALRVQEAGGGATVGGFADLVRRNRRGADATQVGALAGALAGAGQCVSAAGPDAALAAATADGAVASYRADAVAAAQDAAFVGRCAVTLFATTAADVDQLVRHVLVSAPDAMMLVVGVSETSRAAAHLHVAVAAGGSFSAGRLTSASTRRAPFVQLVDIAPTILAARQTPVPASMIGQPWRMSADGRGDVQKTVAELAAIDRRAGQQSRAIVPFFVTEAAFMIAACGVALLFSSQRVSRSDVMRRRGGPAARVACTAAALVPAGSFLAGLFPWWRATAPVLALVAATAVAVAVTTPVALAVAALSGRRPFGPATAVGAITMAVIGVDLLTGGRLQMFTMYGYSPLVAGRFAGIGNVAFGVFAAAALLTAAGLYERFGVVAVVAIGLAALALDGASPWGSDVGGVLALVPAFVALALLLAGVRLSWGKAVVSLAGAVAVVGLLGALDYARPATHRTHLGRFVGQLLHGGAWTVVRRKGVADLNLLTHSALTLLVPALVLAAAWLVGQPPGVLRRTFERTPVLRPTLIATLAMAVIAAVVNDSGVAVPAVAVLLMVPAVMSVVMSVVAADPEGGGKLVA